MEKTHFLGIETTLPSAVLTYNGRVVHDTSIVWSKGTYKSMRELMQAASEWLSKVELADNQRIVIELRDAQ